MPTSDSDPNAMPLTDPTPRIKYKDLTPEGKEQHRHTQFKRIYDGIIEKRQTFMTDSGGVMALSTKGKGYVKNPRTHIHNLMFTKDFLEKGDIVTDGVSVQSIPEDLMKQGVSAEVIINYHHSKHESDELWKLASDYSRERSKELHQSNRSAHQKHEHQNNIKIAEQLSLAGKLLRKHHTGK